MMNGLGAIYITTRSKDYDVSCQATRKEIIDGPPPPPVTGPLEIERPNAESVVRPPSKGVLCKSSYNPNAHAAHHYNIAEDLAQAPYAMSALEVLQSCPSQQKALLSTIIKIDPADSSLLSFNLESFVPRLLH